MTRRRQILSQTSATRDRAQALLRSLMDHKTQTDRVRPRSASAASFVSGTALDRAITSTQRMIETLNRVLEQTMGDVTDEDLQLLDQPKTR